MLKRAVLITLVTIAAVIVLLVPKQYVTIESGGRLSVTSTPETVRAANGVPAVSRGGPPIVSINYEDGLSVSSTFINRSFHFDQRKLDRWAKGKTIAEAEQIIKDYVEANLEYWILLTDLDADDRARELPPVLLDNERIDQRQNKDWLVITTAYFDIQLYDLTFVEGSFITRFNGLGAGQITGNWWE